MTRLYLITGFLGAGKTTFLKNFFRLFRAEKLALLVNEFGKEGVDGTLLSELGVALREITGGSIFCSCRFDQFEEEMEHILEQAPDTVIVEASGLSDPTGIRKLLMETPAFSRVEYKGCICLVDAVRFPKVYATARPCKKQLSISDVIVLNKLDLATPEQRAETEAIVHAQRPDIPIIPTSFGALPEDTGLLLNPTISGTVQEGIHTADVSLRSLTLEVADTLSAYEVGKFVQMFAEDTYRVKGFLRLANGAFLVNCVGNLVQVTPCPESDVTGNHIVVLYGQGLSARKSIQKAMEWYPNLVHFVSE